MDNKTNPNQSVPEELNLTAAINEFPRLFHQKPPKIPGWVLPGWQPLLRRLLTSIDTALTDSEAQEFRVLQVKEKFGTLSFYFQSSGRVRNQINDLVETASQESSTCCMQCGKPASLRNNAGWMSVMCEEHQTQPLSRLGDL